MNRIENVLHTAQFQLEAVLYALAVAVAIGLAMLAAPALAQDKPLSSVPALSQAMQAPFGEAAYHVVKGSASTT
jgi:hypothetical protein